MSAWTPSLYLCTTPIQRDHSYPSPQSSCPTKILHKLWLETELLTIQDSSRPRTNSTKSNPILRTPPLTEAFSPSGWSGLTPIRICCERLTVYWNESCELCGLECTSTAEINGTATWQRSSKSVAPILRRLSCSNYQMIQLETPDRQLLRLLVRQPAQTQLLPMSDKWPKVLVIASLPADTKQATPVETHRFFTSPTASSSSIFYSSKHKFKN